MWSLNTGGTELGLYRMLSESEEDDFAFYNCPSNCSGNGDCMNGTCLCSVQFRGGGCAEKNKSYFISFSVIFYVLSAITTIQLISCVKSEYQKMKHPSLWKACRVTTQKLLYLFVIFASLSRGLYFSLQDSISLHWADNIVTLYYVLLFSGCTLVVCFWAEIFHIQDRSLNMSNPGFLSKSLRFFTIFNLVLYSLMLAQFIASVFVDNPHRLNMYLNGLLAALFIVEVIFFLAYGVEVFFKLKGAFKEEVMIVRPYPLHGSRLGLVFQGALQILIAFFLMMSVTEAKWKDSVPQQKMNYYDVLFRVVELGVALWFPCVLWNSRSLEKLWILNPSIIVKPTNDEEQVPADWGERESLTSFRRRPKPKSYDATVDSSRESPGPECWICYDTESKASGPLIQPCFCTGDVAFVHHECLRKWLLESVDESEASHCKVCKTPYQLARGIPRLYQGFDIKTSFYLVFVLVLMTGAPLTVYYILKDVSSPAGVAGIGACVLIEMMCLKCLGYSLKNVYSRAKIFSLVIIGRSAQSISQELNNDELVVTQAPRKRPEGVSSVASRVSNYDTAGCSGTAPQDIPSCSRTALHDIPSCSYGVPAGESVVSTCEVHVPQTEKSDTENDGIKMGEGCDDRTPTDAI